MERLEGGANEIRGKLKQTHKLPGAKHGPDQLNNPSNTFKEDRGCDLVPGERCWHGKELGAQSREGGKGEEKYLPVMADEHELARDRLARMITQTREQVQNRRGRLLCCASARAALLLFGLFGLNWEPPSAGTWISPAPMALPSSRAVGVGGFQIPRNLQVVGSAQPWRRSGCFRGRARFGKWCQSCPNWA